MVYNNYTLFSDMEDSEEEPNQVEESEKEEE